MKKLNRRGLSIVEMAVTFTLIAIVVFLLFEIAVVLRKTYYETGQKSEVYIKQSLISEKINDDFNHKIISEINSCGIDCFLIIFNDSVEKELSYDSENNLFTYGNYVTEFNENLIIENIVSNKNEYTHILDNQVNAYLEIVITLSHTRLPESLFYIQAIYQYDTVTNPILE